MFQLTRGSLVSLTRKLSVQQPQTTTNSSEGGGDMDSLQGRYKALISGANGGFPAEYAAATKASESNPSYLGRLTKVTAEVNKRNRYCNVLTLDDTRVKLNSVTTGDSDYINASYVRYLDGPTTIVCQGPMKHTTEHFWRMCWEQDIPLIVMLTEFEEASQGGFGPIREKCFRYFTLNENDRMQCGPFTVTCSSAKKTFPGWMERQLRLSVSGSSEVKDILHVHCDEWPDFGRLLPEQVEGLRRSLDLIHSTRNNNRGPAAVHCSAGIGRSGTFVAIDNLLYQANEKHWDDVDPARVVTMIRNQRPCMVQTLSQYEMIYDVLLILLGCDVNQLRGIGGGSSDLPRFEL